MTLPADCQQAIAQATAPWQQLRQQAPAGPALRLLRLDVLRTLARSIHALKSRHLAIGGHPASDGAIGELERRLEELRNSPGIGSPEAPELPECLLHPPGARAMAAVPAPVLQAIGADKLLRYDRIWESAMAAAAAEAGWNFLALETEVPIRCIEAWQTFLHESLWTHAVALFGEAMDPRSPLATDSLWRGRWICVVEPATPKPARLLAAAPLSASKEFAPSIEGARWKLLFSPKNP